MNEQDNGSGSTLQIGEELEGVCGAWIEKGRGYGFLKLEGHSAELFVPARNLRGVSALRRGDRVSFEVRLGYDGRLMADFVELA